MLSAWARKCVYYSLPAHVCVYGRKKERERESERERAREREQERAGGGGGGVFLLYGGKGGGEYEIEKHDKGKEGNSGEDDWGVKRRA